MAQTQRKARSTTRKKKTATGRRPAVPATLEPKTPAVKLRPIRLVINVVQLDPYDRLFETGALSFDGDEQQSAVEKAQQFLADLGKT